ncbi:MAG: diaminopimelate decarboxylase [Candidatus Sumerlaeia bacterium]|nr:diaminopimelate decarboxylase [Candidatus Sumerlaeia bacterium]
MEIHNNKLFIGAFAAEQLARRYGTPLYVYDAETIRRQYQRLSASVPYAPVGFFYACKANTNPVLLEVFRRLGAGLETVSQGEVLAGLHAGFRPDQILFTCSNLTESELDFLIAQGICVNLDSLLQLEKWAARKGSRRVALRVNLGIGLGHHRHVVTGGSDSKFGIHAGQFALAKSIAAQHGLRIVGLQQHIGSNILDHRGMLQAAEALLRAARQFPDLEFVDFGGGIGVPYRPGERPFAVRRWGRAMACMFRGFCAAYGRPLRMVFEPGRYLVAEAGTLLVTVTDIKTTPSRTFIGVDSGFNHLARPALYGAYHTVVNASRVRGRTARATVAGNICEAGDLFAADRALSNSRVGDVLAILNVGAYGFSMSSNYNSRPRPAEVLVSGRRVRLIRERERWQ